MLNVADIYKSVHKWPDLDQKIPDSYPGVLAQQSKLGSLVYFKMKPKAEEHVY